MQKEKPTEIIHNALNPKTSTKIPMISVRRNMSALASKEKTKTRQPHIDDNKPEVLIQTNEFHEYEDQMPL